VRGYQRYQRLPEVLAKKPTNQMARAITAVDDISGAEEGNAGRLARLERWYPMRLVRAYGDSEAGNYAASLAFTTFMSMFPLILGVLAIVGTVIHDDQTQQRFEAAVIGIFPGDARAPLGTALTQVRQHAGILGIVGIAGMMWSGSSVFTSMEWVLGRIFDAHQRDFVRQRLMALIMTVVFVVAIVATVAANTVVGFAGGLSYAAPVVGATVWSAFMALIYRWVPNRTPRLRDLWRGAVLAGVLMECLTLLWPLYAKLSHGFSTYGSLFALFFLLATWLYLFSQLILLGAVASRMRAGRSEVGGLLASAGDRR
jgi:membrane protein